MAIFLVILILCLDQLSKFLIQQKLSLGQSVPVIKGIIHFSLVHNRGAAFGILKNQAPLFIFISLVAIFLIFAHLKISKKFGLYSFSLCLILAGGIGNLIDRLFWGHVIDFLDFRIWPVFNIADSAITIGAILLGWAILTKKDELKS